MTDSQKEEFKILLKDLYSHLQNELSIKETPKLSLVIDKENANVLLGKTGYYDPAEKKIVLFIEGRHPKDILRSFAHEVVHHWQHEKGELELSGGGSDPQYAQKDPHLRKMEKQAYLLGNMMFRDWEDNYKNSND